ncbi:hypothetical protein Tco_0621900 [Tanacetum coccineum]
MIRARLHWDDACSPFVFFLEKGKGYRNEECGETDPYLGRASPSNGVCSHAGSNDLLPAKLKEVLYDNQFEQHWLQAENDRQVVGFGAEMVTDETYGFRGWNWPFTTTSPKGKELAQSKEVSLFWSGMADVRNSAGIDNEAPSSMTHVAEDDETHRLLAVVLLYYCVSNLHKDSINRSKDPQVFVNEENNTRLEERAVGPVTRWRKVALTKSRNLSSISNVGWPPFETLDEAAQRCLYINISEQIRVVMERSRSSSEKPKV